MSNINQLPSLSSDYVLNEEQIRYYDENGHILLKNVASKDEISDYREVIKNAVFDFSKGQKSLNERDTYGKAFIQVSNLWEKYKEIQQFTLARRFAKVAAELMGVDGVRIYHDQALYKEPGGGLTPWHQDQIYWPVDTDKTITMWMPLVDIPAEVGSLTFASGSQYKGYISKLVISDESHKTLQQYVDSSDMEVMTHGAMAAGDATFHAGWTLHAAPGNPSDKYREVMTIIYVADNTKVLEPDTNARKNDLARWMPGCKPGDLVDSPINPLVYKK
ncbi:phytanoyl-CoA dioxygenase family protein [Cytobacillus oceanisediminis]|uniref:phytanoyl-CoA dioxygenase family protein n=1 Tax=Cytobacillus oceanisediminis TaxID=665099 RepID=UPI001CCBDEC0|nr:phytanoyl-CoA dioxygenase family protein [Cytobacillus oceanisediminis]MBZ9536734.1 phytanoyl-CoA dioxygenase family protein [Cytobacillus oceanisediminis]